MCSFHLADPRGPLHFMRPRTIGHMRKEGGHASKQSSCRGAMLSIIALGTGCAGEMAMSVLAKNRAGPWKRLCMSV